MKQCALIVHVETSFSFYAQRQQHSCSAQPHFECLTHFFSTWFTIQRLLFLVPSHFHLDTWLIRQCCPLCCSSACNRNQSASALNKWSARHFVARVICRCFRSRKFSSRDRDSREFPLLIISGWIRLFISFGRIIFFFPLRLTEYMRLLEMNTHTSHWINGYLRWVPICRVRRIE